MLVAIYGRTMELALRRSGGRRAISKALPRRCVSLVAMMLATIVSAHGQSAPGFDPRGAERRFERPQAENAPPRLPHAPRGAAGPADTRPLFVLRGVNVKGAQALPPDVIAGAYRGYLGKPVSQADLAAIANAISEAYRREGFHLSRAIVPPQDIAGGRVHVQVIEGRIAELVVKGDGAHAFGIEAALQGA